MISFVSCKMSSVKGYVIIENGIHLTFNSLLFCFLSIIKTIQHRLADMKTDICVVRAFVDRGLQMADEGVLDPVYASMAKSK